MQEIQRNMIERNDQVELRLSLINGAGIGLFAKKKIKKNTRICDYGGHIEIVTSSQEISLQGDKSFYDATYGRIIHGNETTYGPFINDPRVEMLVNAKIKYNVRTDAFEVICNSTEDIKKGEEIYICYGPQFWDTHS